MPDETSPAGTSASDGLGTLPRLVILALATLGALTLIGWVFSAVLGLAKLALALLILVAVVGWLLRPKD